MAWTSPRTWVAGEVVTAALLNTHLRDNLLAGGDRPAGVAVTAIGGVTSSGTTVYLRNTVTVVNINITTTSAIAADAGLFSIPGGYRPIAQIFGDLVETVAGTSPSYRITCETDGTVRTRVAIASGATLRGSVVLPT